jgi:hypothetical protein
MDDREIVVRFQSGKIFSLLRNVQTDSQVHSACWKKNAGDSFAGRKVAEA